VETKAVAETDTTENFPVTAQRVDAEAIVEIRWKGELAEHASRGATLSVTRPRSRSVINATKKAIFSETVQRNIGMSRADLA
jgi:hypothetical protein